MTIESFIKSLEDLFEVENVFKPEAIIYDYIELSSFNQFLLLSFISDEYGLNINSEDLTYKESVKTIYDIIINFQTQNELLK